jgi:hypothetical protein
MDTESLTERATKQKQRRWRLLSSWASTVDRSWVTRDQHEWHKLAPIQPAAIVAGEERQLLAARVASRQ